MAKKMVRWEGSTRIEDKEAVAKRMRLMREGSKAYFRERREEKARAVKPRDLSGERG